jgi:hypothetical protein
MRSRTKKFAPNSVVVAVDAAVTERRVIRKGDRLRATDPLVKLAPHLFAPEGATEDELNQARVANINSHVEAIDRQITLLTALTPNNPHALRVTQNAMVRLGIDRDVWGLGAGDLVDDRDPRVIELLKTRPELFVEASSA